jgi:hypothetical protein
MAAAEFDPSALMNLDSSLGDEAEVVEVGEDEIRRISGAELRRKCAGLKLASRIVGMAVADGSLLEHADVLRSMEAVVSRLRTMRAAALRAIGVTKDSSDYPAAFNAVTGPVMEILTSEWKYARLGEDIPKLPLDALEKLLDACAAAGPMYYEHDVSLDPTALRRLCVFEALPKVWSVVNMFDYYQRDRGAMVTRLCRIVAEGAEKQARSLYTETSPSFVVRTLLQRSYAVAAGLMCEVYKGVAAVDVAKLRAMPSADRTVVVAQYQRDGGMRYEHIVERFRSVLDRAMDTTNLILEAHREPRKSVEQHYGAIGGT